MLMSEDQVRGFLSGTTHRGSWVGLRLAPGETLIRITVDDMLVATLELDAPIKSMGEWDDLAEPLLWDETWLECMHAERYPWEHVYVDED